MDKYERMYLAQRSASREEHEKWFDMGENVDGSWKHKVWRGINREQGAMIRAAAKYFLGCDDNQERCIQNPDGTFDYEAVYGAEGNGDYRLEDWDGTCAIGLNRREVEQLIGRRVRYTIRGQHYFGRVKRINSKTVSVDVENTNRYWRIPHRLWEGCNVVLAEAK